MLGLFGKKKLEEKQLARIFVNSMINMCQEGFSDIAEMINEDPDLIENPNLSADGYVPFLFVVFSGNLKFLDSYSQRMNVQQIEQDTFEILSEKFETSPADIENHIKKYQGELTRLNHPSKNTLYGMSKLFFHLYDLYPFQEDYYKRIQAPNPIILKRLDTIMKAFLWDWEVINDEYKIV